MNQSSTAANVTIAYYAQSPFDSSLTAGSDNTNAPSVTVTVGPKSLGGTAQTSVPD